MHNNEKKRLQLQLLLTRCLSASDTLIMQLNQRSGFSFALCLPACAMCLFHGRYCVASVVLLLAPTLAALAGSASGAAVYPACFLRVRSNAALLQQLLA